MDKDGLLDIFLVAAPGLEAPLCEEARSLGFMDASPVPGGVTLTGGWPEVWRANLEIRGAAKVLVRIARFRALHLAQLDKRARRVDWAGFLRPDIPLRVEASCRKSRIYHSGAAAQRVEAAIREELGTPISSEAELRVLLRIENDLSTLSIDTSGEPLHRRGHKEEVNKAPMRETLASLFLRQCGYRGTEPVLDPMCGSGTFVIEAAEIAAGLKPGRSRRFAFETLAGFDPDLWATMRAEPGRVLSSLAHYGSDRDAGAVRISLANAARAGVADRVFIARTAIEALEPPPGPAGLVIVNPPYGTRLGERGKLAPLYRCLGEVLRTRFSGWRVGVITSEDALACASGLAFRPPERSVDNGGTRIRLWRTGTLD